MEFFTDGVFAIAATLLVLELTTHSIGEVADSWEFWQGLMTMGHQFNSFVVSFLLLCLLWMTHLQQFSLIDRVDGGLLWINTVRLLFIVLIPFSTVVNTEYENVWLGRLVLPLTFFLAILFGWLGWVYVRRHPELLVEETPEAELRASDRRSLTAVSLGVGSVVLAPFIGSWAFLVFALDPILGMLGRWTSRPGRAGEAPG